MALTAGTRLGPYEVLAPLGAGGMGEVYRARDTRLSRDVAVKVLPEAVSRDADRVRRFEQEARAAGQLSHPALLVVHDVGQLDGRAYLVSELLEGETLRTRMGGTALGPRRALDYARQIAQGLAAAHEKGIVHRDLKPDNIFVTDDGRIKILDFGLAKLTEGAGGGLDSDSPTRDAGTHPGSVLGTAGYMSPEQARGRPADHRSDIFSFGAVLYEMLSGQRAFQGETSADTMTAVLKEDPPALSSVKAGIPPGLERVVRHCLEKSPAERFQSARDLAFDLEAVSESTGQALAASTRTPRAGAIARVAIPLLGAALLAMVAFQLGKGTGTSLSPRPAVRSVVMLPEGVLLACMALSPDGQQLAVNGTDSGGRRRLWVRSLDGLDFRLLRGTDDADLPFWSPDGKSLGFFGGGKLRKVDVSGGSPTDLADAGGTGGTWGPGGNILFSEAAGPILSISEAGGKATPVTKLDEARHETSHRYPQFLPDGRHFLYLAVNLGGSPEDEANRVHIASLDSQEDRVVMRGYSRTLYAEGHLLYVQGVSYSGPLMAQPFDIARLAARGEPSTVAEHVGIYGDYFLYGDFTASNEGTLVYDGEQVVSRMSWFDRAGRLLGNFGEPGVVDTPRLAPDGERVAYSELDSSSNKMQIWVGDLRRGVRTRLTMGPSENARPVWSPDGRRIAYRSDQRHQGDVYSKRVEGGGETPVTEGETLTYPEDWSRDGESISLFRYSADRTPTIGVLKLGQAKPIDLVKSYFTQLGQSRFSPDGRWLAYNDATQRPEVYVTSLPNREITTQISSAGGARPVWRGDGQELFYLTPDGWLMSVEITPGLRLTAGAPRPLFQLPAPKIVGESAEYDATRDGQRFIVVVPVVHGNQVPIDLAQNWTASLRGNK